jgi:PilZ domain-containing protein
VERRAEPRFKTRQLVQITVLGDREVMAPAMLADVSMHGMGLFTNRPVPVGAKVKIALSNNDIVLAEVGRCVGRNDGFIIGLRLQQALTDFGESPSVRRILFAILRDILLPV